MKDNMIFSPPLQRLGVNTCLTSALRLPALSACGTLGEQFADGGRQPGRFGRLGDDGERGSGDQ